MHTESGGASSGNSTSRNSPGQTVVDVGVGGECSTMAQCAAELWIVPSLGISWRLAGRTAISLDSIKGVLAYMSTPRFSTTRPSKVNLWPSRVNDKGVSLTRAGEMSHLLGGRIGN